MRWPAEYKTLRPQSTAVLATALTFSAAPAAPEPGGGKPNGGKRRRQPACGLALAWHAAPAGGAEWSEVVVGASGQRQGATSAAAAATLRPALAPTALAELAVSGCAASVAAADAAEAAAATEAAAMREAGYATARAEFLADGGPFASWVVGVGAAPNDSSAVGAVGAALPGGGAGAAEPAQELQLIALKECSVV